MRSRLTALQNRLELLLVGPLTPRVRRNLSRDLWAAVAVSALSAILSFVPIILRRQGGSEQLLALYYSVSSLGLVTTGVGVALMRRWGMRPVALFSWLIGRASFFLTALAASPLALVLILSVFFVLESWPGPAYLAALQVVYPASQRGRIMAVGRLGLVGGIFLFTPVAGWILDGFGYRVLLPLAGISGIAAALIFYPLLRRVHQVTSAPGARPPSPLQLLRADRRLPLFLSGTTLFGLAILISVPLYPAIQVDRLNLSYTAVGLLGFVQSLVWFFSYLFGGRLLDRLGGIRCLQVVMAINALVMLPYIWATQGWMLLPSFVAAGFVAAGADLAMIYALIDLAGPERTPEYTALNSTPARPWSAATALQMCRRVFHQAPRSCRPWRVQPGGIGRTRRGRPNPHPHLRRFCIGEIGAGVG
jgi:MFS transporter, DHA1 family, inner membrane transport protein